MIDLINDGGDHWEGAEEASRTQLWAAAWSWRGFLFVVVVVVDDIFVNKIIMIMIRYCWSDIPASAAHSKDWEPRQTLPRPQDYLPSGVSSYFFINIYICIYIYKVKGNLWEFKFKYYLLGQDNAITRIENLHRLKCLEYINLAMNAIEVNIECCHGKTNFKRVIVPCKVVEMKIEREWFIKKKRKKLTNVSFALTPTYVK